MKKPKVEEVGKPSQESTEPTSTEAQATNLTQEDGKPSKLGDDLEYVMRIKFVKVIEEGDQELMTVFKISLENFFVKDKKHLPLQRKFFAPVQLDISAGLSMLHGFEAKFGRYDGGAFL